MDEEVEVALVVEEDMEVEEVTTRVKVKMVEVMEVAVGTGEEGLKVVTTEVDTVVEVEAVEGMGVSEVVDPIEDLRQLRPLSTRLLHGLQGVERKRRKKKQRNQDCKSSLDARVYSRSIL